MSRNTLIVILLSSLAGALRSQPIRPQQVTHAQPTIQTALARTTPHDAVALPTRPISDRDDAKYRDLIALLRNSFVSEDACAAPPALLSQR
jgi:hypothetical protein